jgi:UDP-N-acetylglucosamine 2-epimerase (non-hydrolysing)
MILICFGTRPEWLKIKPLLPHLDCKLLFTGQHEDLVKEINFDYTPSYKSTTGNRLDDVISSCLGSFPDDPDIDSVLVQGDTASAFGCALAAFNRGLRVIHLEAGLRSYDLENPYPEEGYRQMISRIATIHLCPTELAEGRLLDERCLGSIEVVGNTVLDNIVQYKDNIIYDNKVLVTLHRRENHDMIAEWFEELDRLARRNADIDFILPIHPNPNVQKHRHLLKSVTVVDPLQHSDLIELLRTCLCTITDSGGIQEEATFLNKKSIVCRTVTERPEAVNHLKLCLSPKDLERVFNDVVNDPIINEPCPYGDGKSAQKVKEILWQNQSIIKE